MKLRVTLALSYGIAQVAASPHPELQWDPASISTCDDWWNNGGSDTCESIRSMFSISPEDFHKWNPSVGIDCKPWRYQSYCILTKERLSSLKSSTTTAMATTVSTTSSTHAPSPTSWNALGCYTDDDAKYPVLEKQVSSDDSALQISSCEDKCWKASTGKFFYAGVKQGNQCCGNKQEMCGGKERINVFEPVTTTVSSKTTTAGTIVAATSAKQSSGAAKNRNWF